MKFVKWNSLLKMTLTLSLVLGLGLMAGCGDDDDPTTPPGGGDITGGTITWTLDGTPMDFSEGASATNMGDVDERIVGGTGSGTGQVILITFPKATGTYTITSGSAGNTGISIANGSDVWGCVAGSIILDTSTDTHLVGSFIGTFEDMNANTVLVTNGAFDVPLNLVQ